MFDNARVVPDLSDLYVFGLPWHGFVRLQPATNVKYAAFSSYIVWPTDYARVNDPVYFSSGATGFIVQAVNELYISNMYFVLTDGSVVVGDVAIIPSTGMQALISYIAAVPTAQKYQITTDNGNKIRDLCYVTPGVGLTTPTVAPKFTKPNQPAAHATPPEQSALGMEYRNSVIVPAGVPPFGRGGTHLYPWIDDNGVLWFHKGLQANIQSNAYTGVQTINVNVLFADGNSIQIGSMATPFVYRTFAKTFSTGGGNPMPPGIWGDQTTVGYTGDIVVTGIKDNGRKLLAAVVVTTPAYNDGRFATTGTNIAVVEFTMTGVPAASGSLITGINLAVSVVRPSSDFFMATTVTKDDQMHTEDTPPGDISAACDWLMCYTYPPWDFWEGPVGSSHEITEYETVSRGAVGALYAPDGTIRNIDLVETYTCSGSGAVVDTYRVWCAFGGFSCLSSRLLKAYSGSSSYTHSISRHYECGGVATAKSTLDAVETSDGSGTYPNGIVVNGSFSATLDGVDLGTHTAKVTWTSGEPYGGNDSLPTRYYPHVYDPGKVFAMAVANTQLLPFYDVATEHVDGDLVTLTYSDLKGYFYGTLTSAGAEVLGVISGVVSGFTPLPGAPVSGGGILCTQGNANLTKVGRIAGYMSPLGVHAGGAGTDVSLTCSNSNYYPVQVAPGYAAYSAHLGIVKTMEPRIIFYV